jgi:tetratricopeptide (TPR) repeat protein
MAMLSAFNPHEFSEATVRTIATGREEDLKEVLAAIRSNLESETMQHLIVSAPRGYGKSFMMRHVQIEAQRIAREENLPIVVALMPEEMPHVREPETLLRELARTVAGGAGATAELTWHEDEDAAWDDAVDALKTAIEEKAGARGLCIALVENFDLLLRRAFSKEAQESRLRALLSEQGGRLMLIAASASGAFDRNYGNRFFQAFKEIPLAPWSVDECLEFFDRQRKDAGKLPLAPAAAARARAVATFIGGTPRLATLLGDALLAEDVLGAAELLQRLVDELTPYYKERIDALPGRAQKLLDALLRGGEPATQSEIARRVNARSQSAIAGPFNDLVRERIVFGEKAPGSAEVLYRVADRVFAHYYRRRIIDHGKNLCPLEGLVELLAGFFSPEEKQAKAEEFLHSGRLDEARVMARLHDADRGTCKAARLYILRDLGRVVIPKRLSPLASAAIAEDLRGVATLALTGDADQAYLRVTSALEATQPADHVLLLLARSMLDAFEGFDGGIGAAQEAGRIAATVSDSRLALVAGLACAWSLIQVERFSEVLELAGSLFERAAALGDAEIEAGALSYAAYAEYRLGRKEAALALAQRSEQLATEVGDLDLRSSAVSVAAECLAKLGRPEEAVATGTHAAELSREAGDADEETWASYWVALSLQALGRHEEALAQARRAADLAEAIGDRHAQGWALLRLSYSLGELERHEEAIEAATRSAGRARETQGTRLEAFALRDLGWSLVCRGRHREAADVLRNAARCAEKAKRTDVQAQSLRLLAWSLARSGDVVAAIEAQGAAAAFLDVKPNKKEVDWLVDDAGNRFLFSIQSALFDGDLDALHGLLHALAQHLDHEGLRQKLLQIRITNLTREAIEKTTDPERLESIAAAIALHFPNRFADELAQLRGAARYHAGNRDRAALARLDPDFARTLEVMFPPPS